MDPKLSVFVNNTEDNVSVLTDAVSGGITSNILTIQGQDLAAPTTTTTETLLNDDLDNVENDILMPLMLFDDVNNQPTEGAVFLSPSRVPTDQPESPMLQRKKSLSEDEYDRNVDNGYDSDGFILETDLEYSGDDILEEEVPSGGLLNDLNESVAVIDNSIIAVNNLPANITEEGVQVQVPVNNNPVEAVLSEREISLMKVPALKKALEERGVTGIANKTKPWLANRLREILSLPLITNKQLNNDSNINKSYDGSTVAIAGNINIRNKEKSTIPGFSATAKWMVLQPDHTPVAEPPNQYLFRAPNSSDNESMKKFNYTDKFEREDFIGSHKVPKLDRNGKVRRQSNTNFPVLEEVPAAEGAPKPEFIQKNKLTTNSTPNEWFRAFLPQTADSGKFCTNNWCKYTNTKAQVVGAGTKKLYPGFVDFNPQEIEQHIGLYILHGLTPSPHVEMKFNRQDVDPVNGNDLCARVFGSNAKKRHKMFKLLFTVQDPYKPMEDRTKNPYHKVNSFLKWMKQISIYAWNPGMHLAGDEQTIGFQGRHEAKQRITYKNEGDGFQCDALCDQGYTLNFYFRNAPPPVKYVKEGWSPLHARMLFMMECLQNKHHRIWMDNLYISAKFAKCFLLVYAERV
jgi:Transposase IS4